MKLRTPLAAGLGLIAAAYVAYPCLTLYRLQSALARGDTVTLNRLVDWSAVRQGIEADLASERHDALPMFGAGFMRRIAVKSEVNPDSVVSALRVREQESPSGGTGISDAWLEGPRRLMIEADGMRMRMDLGLDGWQVTRVWLPHAVLATAMRTG